MARKRWSDLSPKAKGAVVGLAAVDAGLRAWALRDLASRTKDQVNGPKMLWQSGMAVVNSAGILPLVYLVRGRRSTPDTQTA
ncbi:hypothetical protein HUN08_13990 [Gordonia sp. X0973]|uniref:hypothetical protein n=1 Tax=Gordonia sp. X0973 TaxID=2742602 RepID=UPI000F52FA38|nr:hypothetical protein [Gordonia sp. X0973]QKT08180.1 hypothetical protein HUN08_13990 [Gordonia sp. X0973]